MSNIKWTTDEWLIALAFYLEHRESFARLNRESPEIKRLSEQLRRLRNSLAGVPASYRNPTGVFMQVASLAGLDPDHKWKGTRPSKLAREVWEAHAQNPEWVKRVAQQIRMEANPEYPIPSPEALSVMEAPEGRVLTYLHIRRERNASLVRKKKALFTERYGRLFCEICIFDYEKRYGPHGRGFIETHHTRPVSELDPDDGSVVKLTDLLLICASCHRMIHHKRPWLTPEALKSKIRPLTLSTPP